MIKKLAVSLSDVRRRTSQMDPVASPDGMSPEGKPARANQPWWRRPIVLAGAGLVVALSPLLFTDSARAVRTGMVERGPLTATLSVTGRIVAANRVDLSAMMAGTVAIVHVKEGSHVRRGQSLVSLDMREALAASGKAQANVRQANEEQQQLLRAYESARRLHEVGGESRQAVDDAESRLRLAEIKTQIAQEDLRLATIGLRKVVIRAPFDGVITTVTAQIGQWAAPGAALVSVADVNEREIEAKADADDSGVVQVGLEANVTSDAYPGQQWRERVLRVAPAVNKGDSTNSVNVSLTLGSQAPELRLGQQVDVKILTSSKTEAVKVPITALVNQHDGVVVLLVRDGRIHFAPVRTGIEDFSHMEIVAGLAGGEQIVLPEGKSFNEGERVKPMSSNP